MSEQIKSVIIIIILSIPWLLYIHALFTQDKEWRKNIKVGDRCYYPTYSKEHKYFDGEILQIDINNGSALVQRFSEPSSFDQWYDIEELRKY